MTPGQWIDQLTPRRAATELKPHHQTFFISHNPSRPDISPTLPYPTLPLHAALRLLSGWRTTEPILLNSPTPPGRNIPPPCLRRCIHSVHLRTIQHRLALPCPRPSVRSLPPQCGGIAPICTSPPTSKQPTCISQSATNPLIPASSHTARPIHTTQQQSLAMAGHHRTAFATAAAEGSPKRDRASCPPPPSRMTAML